MVGGCVRDEIMGIEPKDIDIEMYGVKEADVEAMLKASAHHVLRVGRAFPVWKAWGEGMGQDQAIDVALPRREVKTGTHHTAFAVTLDPSMTFAEAALRRDFTMNSIGKDPLTGEMVDPHGGVQDIQKKVLRHTSPHFAEDPLRVLRGMQFCARYGLTPDPETVQFCAKLTPEGLSSERIFGEWSKLILKGREPSNGLDFLQQTGWVKHFPELASTIGVPQDPEWHPEGDVWTHTKHCLDAFASRHFGDEAKDLRVGLAVLCHDFGKVTHTKMEKGRWCSPGHEEAGMAPAETFLRRMTDQTELIQGVCALVGSHMIPHGLRVAAEKKPSRPHAMDPAVRRLALRLGKEGTGIDELCLVSTCDNAGRPPLPPLARAAKWLQSRAEVVGTVSERPKQLLQGRDLIALGHQPSPAFKNLLGVVFERQLDGEVQTPEEALALAKDILAGRPVAGAPLDTITLYRAGLKSPGKAAIPSWADADPVVQNTKAASGRWFTDDLAEAQWYLKNEYFDNGHITSVTVPRARVEFYRVSNIAMQAGNKATPDNPVAFSRRPEKEFFLPIEIAALATPFVPPEPAPLSAQEQLRQPEIAPENPAKRHDSPSIE